MSETYFEEFTTRLERRASDDAVLSEERFNTDGERHSDPGPAVIKYAPGTRKFARLEFWRNGKLHRSHGPAIEVFEPSSNSYLERYWYRNGMLHNSDNEPAIIISDRSGIFLRREFWVQGKLHRERGPAVVVCDPTGKTQSVEYYRHGQKQPTAPDSGEAPYPR